MIIKSDLLFELNFFIILHLLLEYSLLLHRVRVLLQFLTVVVRITCVLHLRDPLIDPIIAEFILLELGSIIDLLLRVGEVLLIAVINNVFFLLIHLQLQI